MKIKNLLKEKRVLNFIVITLITYVSFWWTFFIFHKPFENGIVLFVLVFRMLASLFLFRDYSLSWSKASQKTFLTKSLINILIFLIYMPLLYGEYRIAFMASELFFYLFSINFFMFSYYFWTNKNHTPKTKELVIYGAGRAGLKLKEEFDHGSYKIKCFVDDDIWLQKRSIDGLKIVSVDKFIKNNKIKKLDLLVIAIPSASNERIKEIYELLSDYFYEVKIVPSLNEMLSKKTFIDQLKSITLEELLARKPKDLDRDVIEKFIKDKTILITGAGGSIGSQLSRECVRFGAKQIILLDHSEFNLYSISEELQQYNIVSVMCSVVDKEELEELFVKYNIDLVIHAAAYKHVWLVEQNIRKSLINNILGTKNCIDLAIKHNVKNFVFISTDKAVRPTNVMGASKRICELYAQNVITKKTEVVCVRFGNVLGSSGSVIPKFKEQILKGGPVTVTDPEVTRYFMLIPEACELVLQAGAIGAGGEIFILNMGKPVKIFDLAKKMIALSGRRDVKIIFTGLRRGEKMYEELLIDESEAKTKYDSITVASKTFYDIDKLNNDIDVLLKTNNQLEAICNIVPEFKHVIN